MPQHFIPKFEAMRFHFRLTTVSMHEGPSGADGGNNND